MESRAMHEIQCDAYRLIEVRLKSAVEACDWVAVHRCTEQLEEIVQRGLYHASKEKQQEVAALAMRQHVSEPDAR